MSDESKFQTMTVEPQNWISPEEYLEREKTAIVKDEIPVDSLYDDVVLPPHTLRRQDGA